MSGVERDPTDAPRSPPHRAYIRRRGRMTAGQARALATHQRYCLPYPGSALDPSREFGRAAPLGLEIGFGMGQALLAWATTRPDWNLLGLELYQPGIGAVLLGLERERLDHVRVAEAPAEGFLAECIAPGALDEIRIFFPDPWPKKRHARRRLIQPAFAELLVERLRPGGLLWLATDWDPYAAWITEVLGAESLLSPVAAEDPTAGSLAGERPTTRFEARGTRLGHAIRDLLYRRNA